MAFLPARLISCALPAAVTLATLVACAPRGDEGELVGIVSTPLRFAVVKALSTVNVKGKGAIGVEEDYLPKVVCCENGAAHAEALKAQAVMARTYMYFRYYEEDLGTSGKPLTGTTADQAYFCASAVTDACRGAVQATREQVTTFDDGGMTTANVSFFVDGPRPACLAKKSCTCDKPEPSVAMTPSDHPADCDCFTFASQGAANPAYVTYNWSKSSDAVIGSSIGNPKHESNRGCGSQNIQSCLGYAGWTYHDMLRFAYGQDIELRSTTNGELVGEDGPTPTSGAPAGSAFLPSSNATRGEGDEGCAMRPRASRSDADALPAMLAGLGMTLLLARRRRK